MNRRPQRPERCALPTAPHPDKSMDIIPKNWYNIYMPKPKKDNRKTIIFCILAPLACCLIYAFFCMLNLHGSVWFDESYSAYLARGDFGQIWHMTSLDVHPPFYYFLLKIWSGIFGYTDVSMRFMSVFFGALTIIFLFHLIKRWFGEKAAALSTFFLSLSPMFIRYGQEMRMYTLVFLIVILATYVLDLALETKKTRYYILYAVLISLGMWTHYFTAIAWIAHIVYYKITKRAKIFEKKMLLTYIGAVALFVPWMPSLFKQFLEVESGFWIPGISILTPVDYATQSLIFAEVTKGGVNILTGLLVLITVGALVYITRKVCQEIKKSEKPKLYFLISLIIFPPLILMLISVPPLTSMFVDRYILYSISLIWALIGLVIFLSIKLHGKDKRSLAVAILLIIASLTSAVFGIINVETREPKGPIQEIVYSVHAMAEDGEPIVANNEWNYYDAVFYDTEKNPVYGVRPWINFQYGSIFPIDILKYHLYDTVEDLTNSTDKFWYITDLKEGATSLEDYDLPKEIPADYRVVSEVSTPKNIAFKFEKDRH